MFTLFYDSTRTTKPPLYTTYLASIVINIINTAYTQHISICYLSAINGYSKNNNH